MTQIIKTAGMLILKENKVLLVEHTTNASHLTGVHGFPAGRCEENETEINCGLRELQEETGLTAKKEDLVEIPKTFIANIKRKDGIKTMSYKVYLCKKYSGQLKSSEENICKWVEIDKLDELNLLPNIKEIINLGKNLQ